MLNDFKTNYPDQVVTSAGDMDDLDYVRSILSDIELDGRLDALILNHGTLGACLRIGDTGGDEWASTFRINVTSYVVLVSLFIDRCTDGLCIHYLEARIALADI